MEADHTIIAIETESVVPTNKAKSAKKSSGMKIAVPSVKSSDAAFVPQGPNDVPGAIAVAADTNKLDATLKTDGNNTPSGPSNTGHSKKQSH